MEGIALLRGKVRILVGISMYVSMYVCIWHSTRFSWCINHRAIIDCLGACGCQLDLSCEDVMHAEGPGLSRQNQIVTRRMALHSPADTVGLRTIRTLEPCSFRDQGLRPYPSISTVRSTTRRSLFENDHLVRRRLEHTRHVFKEMDEIVSLRRFS